MALWVLLIGVLCGVLIGVFFSYRTAVNPLQNKISNQLKKQRLYQKYISHSSYPYSEDNFRFIGGPVDGIQFEDNQIIFINFVSDTKTDLQDKQHFKQLVTSGKIQWLDLRI